MNELYTLCPFKIFQWGPALKGTWILSPVLIYIIRNNFSIILVLYRNWFRKLSPEKKSTGNQANKKMGEGMWLGWQFLLPKIQRARKISKAIWTTKQLDEGFIKRRAKKNIRARYIIPPSYVPIIDATKTSIMKL